MKLLCVAHLALLIPRSTCWNHWMHSHCFPPRSCEGGEWIAPPACQVAANTTCTTSDIYASTQNKRIKLATTRGHLAYKPPNHCRTGKKLETCAYLPVLILKRADHCRLDRCAVTDTKTF